MHNSEKVCSNDYEILPLLLRPSHVPCWGFVCPACLSPSCCCQNNVARVSLICNSGRTWTYSVGSTDSQDGPEDLIHVEQLVALHIRFLAASLHSQRFVVGYSEFNVIFLYIYLLIFSMLAVSEMCYCLAVKYLQGIMKIIFQTGVCNIMYTFT